MANYYAIRERVVSFLINIHSLKPNGAMYDLYQIIETSDNKFDFPVGTIIIESNDIKFDLLIYYLYNTFDKTNDAMVINRFPAFGLITKDGRRVKDGLIIRRYSIQTLTKFVKHCTTILSDDTFLLKDWHLSSTITDASINKLLDLYIRPKTRCCQIYIKQINDTWYADIIRCLIFAHHPDKDMDFIIQEYDYTITYIGPCESKWYLMLIVKPDKLDALRRVFPFVIKS